MIDAQWLPLVYAAVLMLAAVGLLILEFFVVSAGLLSLAALACATGSVYFAFQLGTATGYGFILVATVFAIITVRWGLRRLKASSAVPKSEIVGDAGYHHVAERLGIAVGSAGVLVTPARPSGRARFSRGECDVQVRGPARESGTQVVIDKIDGPIIFVIPTAR